MKISLDLNKSVEENAANYFEKAKKSKKKIDGINEAIGKAEVKIKKLKKKKDQQDEKEAEQEKKVKRKQEWYEKFRWFISSEGFLVIGGRDATSNEIIIKKHTDKEDIVCHTDMSGSPFFVIKANKKEIGKQTIKEAIDATFNYSKAWKLGLTTGDVFWVTPEQVTKEAQSGEHLGKGAFMIRGKTNYIPPDMNLAIGITKDDVIMGGPLSAIKKNCEKFVEIEQGKEKTSAIAKKIRSKIGGELDEIVKVIPAGGVKIKEQGR